MNERSTNTDLDAPREEREYPRPNAVDTPRSDGEGNKMSTADLAYGKNRDSNDGAPRTDTSGREDHITLIQEEDAGGFRERWTSIQTKFIDEPRETVSDADELVAEVIQSLARRFAEERQSMESQWQSGSEVSTEDLRLAMHRYRAFFERLLAA